MTKHTKVHVILAAIAAFSGLLSASCGARMDSGAVTETGNPSFIKDTRITATPLEGVVIVKGSEGAVPKGAQVTIVNEANGADQTTTANDDGSFELTVEGSVGDTIAITVVSGRKSETKQLQVSSAPGAPALHREHSETCDDVRPPGPYEDAPAEADAGNMCRQDADCSDGTLGRCIPTGRGNWPTCTYDACTQDSDCTTGGPCICEREGLSYGNRCMSGNCHIDSDCGSDSYCSPSPDSCGPNWGTQGYWCRTPSDECVKDADCTAGEFGEAGYCFYSPEASHWMCGHTHCVG